ncbi:transcriptional regulator [Salinigranum rubrum]|uniref:Transcriptional regulator n=1 Tax=Salinigranum rubrum TaxID=755307 RepID=A0A2I8VK46_9EURY|nr:multiprotein-bridging factor 1 family protein [Salinigranum rubrum]AUV82302.1 transcriptional regulator [Salinigranum rubrum]
MAKYSTGSGGGGDAGDACELCGKETGDLRRANVAGADLLVCGSCAPHGDQRGGGGGRDRSGSGDGSDDSGFEGNRKKRAAQRAAKMYDKQKGDPTHWEKEGTNYEKDRLPYLVSGYGDIAEEARQAEGLQLEELATELDVDEADLLAVEQGRASRAGVGGSVIRALENRLDVRLIDE